MLCCQYFVPLEHILESFPYHIWHLLWFIICQTLMTAHKYAATHNDTSVPDLLWQSCSRNRWVMLPFQFQNLYNDPDFLSTIWIICMWHIAACPVMLLLCGGCKHNYLDRTGPVVRPRKTGTRTLASSVHLKDQVCSWTGKKRLNPWFLGREGGKLRKNRASMGFEHETYRLGSSFPSTAPWNALVSSMKSLFS